MNLQHETELKSLCTALMGEEVLQEIADKDLKDQRWTKYGFQNSNPRTDFRGAGILGVRNLTYFAQNHPELIPKMT